MKVFLVFLIAVFSSSFAVPLSSRIIGGVDATPGQYPYQVVLQWGFLEVFADLCGGSIISPTWVVTAATCVTSLPPTQEVVYRIIAGVTNLNSQDQGQQVNVNNIIINPNFPGEARTNDIALLQLETALNFNDIVQPIGLPVEGHVLEGTATLSGWAAVGVSNVLQTLEVPIMEIEKCKNKIDEVIWPFDPSPVDLVTNVCSGYVDPRHRYAACSLDDGSPLVQDGTLVGIVSWQINPCEMTDIPIIYCNVAAFINFITSNVNDLPTLS